MGKKRKSKRKTFELNLDKLREDILLNSKRIGIPLNPQKFFVKLSKLKEDGNMNELVLKLLSVRIRQLDVLINNLKEETDKLDFIVHETDIVKMTAPLVMSKIKEDWHYVGAVTSLEGVVKSIRKSIEILEQERKMLQLMKDHVTSSSIGVQ